MNICLLLYTNIILIMIVADDATMQAPDAQVAATHENDWWPLSDNVSSAELYLDRGALNVLRYLDIRTSYFPQTTSFSIAFVIAIAIHCRWSPVSSEYLSVSKFDRFCRWRLLCLEG